MKINLKYILSIILLFTTSVAFGQTNEHDFISMMREGGKIYVVYLVLAVILVGILGYLISLELKVRKLEKKQQGK